MTSTARPVRPVGVAAVILLGLSLLGGCDDGSGSDGVNGPGEQSISFARDISFGEFEGIVSSGVTRVEVELLGGGTPAIAREIEVESSDDDGEEEIESHVIAPGFSAEVGPDCNGTLTLAPDGLEVAFDQATAFELDDDDGGDDSDLTCADFVTLINGAIDAGREPRLEAERPAMPNAAAPPNEVFVATKIELESSEDGGSIQLELAIEEANLLECGDLPSTPPEGCLGVVQLAGLMVVIQDGVTELEEEQPDAEDAVEFEGLVASVDLTGEFPTFTLSDGRTIRVIEGTTEIEVDDDDEEEYLTSLEEVEQALALGPVEAEGEAVPDPDNAGIWIAIEVEFEIEDEG